MEWIKCIQLHSEIVMARCYPPPPFFSLSLLPPPPLSILVVCRACFTVVDERLVANLSRDILLVNVPLLVYPLISFLSRKNRVSIEMEYHELRVFG